MAGCVALTAAGSVLLTDVLRSARRLPPTSRDCTVHRGSGTYGKLHTRQKKTGLQAQFHQDSKNEERKEIGVERAAR